MLAIGANDLTAELGVPGRYDDPRVRDAVATAADACRRHGKLLMVGGIADLDLLASLEPLGVCPLQLAGSDTDLLFAGAAARAKTFSHWRGAGRGVPGQAVPGRGENGTHDRDTADHADAAGWTNTRPRFTMPPRACDAHFHVFEPGFPHVPDPLYTFPDGTLEQYLRMAGVLGIERMVLVQPTFYGTDNRLLAEVLRRLGPRARGVVRIEEETSDAELDHYHELGVRAIRLDLFARANWPTAEIIGYVRRMAARAAPRGWHIQFYTPGTVVRDLLPFLADLEDPFVIDHMGYMLEADGLTAADFDRLLGVLAQGSCWIKLSGPYRIAKSRPLSYVAPVGRALVSTRPDRLIWGSDWPHLPDGQRDTGELLNLLADWAPDEADRHQILVESPERLFFSD